MPFDVRSPAQHKTAGDCATHCWSVHFACDNGHGGKIGAEEMGQRFPAETRLEDIAQRLVCKTCGSRDGALDVMQDNAAASRKDLARFKADGKYRKL